MTYYQFIHALRDLIEDWKEDTEDRSEFMQAVSSLFHRYTKDHHDEPTN